MLKKAPKTIQIGGITFRVVERPLEDSYGQIDLYKRQILLDPERGSEEELVVTFLHECMHACLQIGGLSIVLGEKEEEAVVECMQNLFLPVLEKLLK